MFEQYEVLCFSRFRPIRYKSPAKLLLLSVFTNRDRRISRVLPISCPQKEPKVKIVRTCGVAERARVARPIRDKDPGASKAAAPPLAAATTMTVTEEGAADKEPKSRKVCLIMSTYHILLKRYPATICLDCHVSLSPLVTP